MKNKVQTKIGGKFGRIMRSDMGAFGKARTIAKVYSGIFMNIPIYIALVALATVFIVPFFYMIGHALMSQEDILNSSVVWLPRHMNFENFVFAFERLNYLSYLIKSVVVVMICVFAQMMSCSFVAYGLARTNFKLRGVVFGLILFMLVVPPQTIIVPSYIMFVNFFGWQGEGTIKEYLPIIVPYFTSMGINGGLFVFVYRQFYSSMPKELENAAMIDGTGIMGAYFRVILPNSRSAMLITFILSMVWRWNDEFDLSIYVKNRVDSLLPAQLSNINSDTVMTGIDLNQGIMMSATLLVVLPVILMFFIFQGRFMRNITTTGLAN